MAIELGALRTVIAAAEHRSFRRAAAALNLKQSTLSRRVRQLEAQFGVELFERSSGGVRVTAAGDKVVSAARHVLEQLNRMVSTARPAGRGEAGNIKIGVCTSLSGSKLHGVLAEYLQAYPDIEIQVVEQCRSRLLDALRTGDTDVVIIVGDAEGPGRPSMSLWSERIIVALPAQHRLASNDLIYWTDLKGESFLMSGSIAGLLGAPAKSPGARPDLRYTARHPFQDDELSAEAHFVG
jgi:DNA-binding transcriptional LysR family regulator